MIDPTDSTPTQGYTRDRVRYYPRLGVKMETGVRPVGYL
jgi:hypothetical protein